MTYPDTAAGARALIETELADRARDYLTTRLDSGELALIPDPVVGSVWGIVTVRGEDRPGGETIGVLYLADADFELADSVPF